MADKKTVISTNHRPPAWISTGTAIVAFLLVSKGMLIDTLPVRDELRLALTGWFTYLLNVSGVLFGIASIFVGQKTTGPDTDYPN